MASALLTALLALAAPLQAQQTDSTAYASPATRRLVERALARRQEADTVVRDYRARLRYRLSASLGRRRWARTPTLGVEEQDALVQWQLPNDLRVDVLGRRSRMRSEEGDFRTIFARPWFVPRSVGDSVRITMDDSVRITAQQDSVRITAREDSVRITMDDSVRRCGEHHFPTSSCSS